MEGALVFRIVCTTSARRPTSLSWSPSGAKCEGSKARAGDEILSPVLRKKGPSCLESQKAVSPMNEFTLMKVLEEGERLSLRPLPLTTGQKSSLT